MKKVLMILFAITLISACSNSTNTVQEKKELKAQLGKEHVIKETSIETKQVRIPDYPKAAQRKILKGGPDASISNFRPDPIQNENKATYKLDLTMDSDEKFTVTAEVKVENTSKDEWNEIVFYFIPNAFTEENKPESLKNAAEVSISSIELDGEKADYLLDHDTLYLPLEESFKPGEERSVTVRYTLTVPEFGFRLSNNFNNIYLAEWYPMLATYHSGWRKEDYIVSGESYFTDYSDFIVKYSLPEEYMVLSTADNDPATPSASGELESQNVKEFYMALTKNMEVVQQTAGDVEVRVAGVASTESLKQILEKSVNALNYFSAKLSPYPQKQIDIIADEGGMEYPGIVTIGPFNEGHKDEGRGSQYFALIHEIAHQWFYGTVNNDPYYDVFIDEGLTNFATYLFLIGHDKKTPEETFAFAEQHAARTTALAHLPLHEYLNGGFMGANYEIPPLKLWELTGGEKEAFDYLSKYVELYSYQEVDTAEWIRFTKSYFKLNDDQFFQEWISYE